MQCPLCDSPSGTIFFKSSPERSFFECGVCRLVFLDRAQLLSSEEEKARYLLHENALADPDYRKFLNRLVDPILERVSAGAVGLDYGCGPVEAMQALFAEAGIAVKSYDPFFFPDRAPLREEYDFLILSEVVEHFNDPRKEFDFLKTLVKPGGLIGVSMSILREGLDFASWHYHRDPTHVNFFREETLTWLANHLGWDLELRRDSVTLFRA